MKAGVMFIKLMQTCTHEQTGLQWLPHAIPLTKGV